MITRSTVDEKQPLRDMTLAADGINQVEIRTLSELMRQAGAQLIMT